MAIVREYDRQIGTPSADFGRRANAQDMGFAQGISDLAHGIGDASAIIRQRDEQEEISRVHVDMAKSNADWSEQFVERQKSATPGDKGFAKSVNQDMQEYFGKMSENYTTRAGKNAFASQSATMVSHYSIAASQYQVKLAGDYAKVQYKELSETLGRTAFNDPTQYAMLKERAIAAIDDKGSMYSNLDESVRAELKRSMTNDIDLATVKGIATQAPAMLLSKVSPEVMTRFKPVTQVTQQGNNSEPQTVESVFPSLIKAESNGVHKGSDGELVKSSKGAKGITQVMPETAADPGFGVKPLQNDSEEEYIRFGKDYLGALQNYYKGDMTKAIAAYNAGPGTINSAIAAAKNPKNENGGDWTNYIPEETKQYITKVGAGNVQVASTPSYSPDTKPEKIGIEAFDNLSWKEQYEAIHTAEQSMRLNQTSANQARVESERIAKQKQEETMNGMFDKLLDNKLSVNDIRNDSILTFQQREHMLKAINTNINAKDNTDANVFTSVFKGIHDGSVTSEDQINNLMGNGLSILDVQRLRGELSGKSQPLGEVRKSFTKMAESQISKSSLLSKDPEGDAQFYRWTQFVDTVIAEKTKEGIPLSRLYNPNDKEYIGWTINQFTRTMKQVMNDSSARMRGTPPQPEKGQTQPQRKSLDDIFAGKK